MHQKSLFHDSIHWELEAHALSLSWKNFTPHLICSIISDSSIRAFTFSHTLDMELTNDKICTGRWEESSHVPCPTSYRTSRFQRCDQCADPMVPDQWCIFEPRCRGDSCLVAGHLGESITFCSRPHAVYLAFYLDHVKIGMTSQERVRPRCIEQGADAFLVIAHTGNRYEARQLEKQLARSHSLRQSFNNTEILRMTKNRIDPQKIESISEKTLTEMRKSGISVGMDLQFLDGYPITFPFRSIPRETTTSGLHIGKISGIKGRFLYYESNGLRALNINDIPARKIHFNATSFL